MLILCQEIVERLLAGRERETVGLVEQAYRLHDEGRTSVPHSVFLRFPDEPRNRMIGLPAYLGGPEAVAGMKWISSFPGNIDRGIERASAAILLNSMATGHPEALIEGSVISAKRTAAGAALAARVLTDGTAASSGLIGCGVINFEILRFLAAVLPGFATVTVHDRDPARAEAFRRRAGEELPHILVELATDAKHALGAHRLVSIATTAAQPHMGLEDVQPGAVVLHVSLRDLHPSAILGAVNVVDDADHVCRERTSLHLAEQEVGDRSFIHAPIGALVRGGRLVARRPGDVVVFSPFGLGVLDLALAAWVRAAAEGRGLGERVAFLRDGAAAAAH